MKNFSEYLEKYDRGEIKNFEELYQNIKDENYGYDELEVLGKRYISYREPSVILNFAFPETEERYHSEAIYSFLKHNKIFDKKEKDRLILFDMKLKINFIIDLKLNKNNLEERILDLFEKTYSSFFSIIRSSKSELEDKDFEKLSNNEKIIEKEENEDILKKIFKRNKSKFIEVFEVYDDKVDIEYMRNRKIKKRRKQNDWDFSLRIDELMDELYGKVNIEDLKIGREIPRFKDMNKSDISGEKVDNLIENEEHRNNIQNRDINEENYKLYNLLKFKAKEKLLTLNYNNNEEEIEEIFKNVYGDLNYEQNLTLLLNKSKEIVKVIDTTLVDFIENEINEEEKKLDEIMKSKYNISNDIKNIGKVSFKTEEIFEIIKKNEDIKYIVKLHNHSENIPIPSIQDLNVNNTVYKDIINKIFSKTRREIILYKDLIITKDNIVDINILNDSEDEKFQKDFLERIYVDWYNLKNLDECCNINKYLEKDGFIRKIVGMSSKENREKLIKKYEDNFEKALREKLEKIRSFKKLIEKSKRKI